MRNLPSYNINVAKGVGGGSQDSSQTTVKVKNTDIRHIKTGDKSLSHTHILYAKTILYWAIYPLLIIILVIITLIAIKRHKANADVVGMRRTKAGKVARKRLAVANTLMNKNDSAAFYDAILKALWGYISDKLSMPISSLTRNNISEELLQHGADESTISKVIEVLDECEMARYTPESLNRPLKDVYDSAFEAMNALQSISK